MDDIFYLIDDDLIVDFDTNNTIVRFLFYKTDILKVEALIVEIKKFKIRKSKRKPEIFLLINTKHGMDCKSMEISKPKLRLADNYNDDF